MRINPKLTAEAAKRITTLYADLRAKVDGSQGRTLPVTARTLETIIRLSSAHAKVRHALACFGVGLHLQASARFFLRSSVLRHLSCAISQAHLRNLVTEEDAEAAMQILNFAIFSDSAKAAKLCTQSNDGGDTRHRENGREPRPEDGESLGGVLVVQERKTLVMSALDRLFVESAEEVRKSHAHPNVTPIPCSQA